MAVPYWRCSDAGLQVDLASVSGGKPPADPGSDDGAGKRPAAVCHGPVGLLGARLSDGSPLIKGKRVNGFTNSAEKAAGLEDVVPFMLEDELKALGGQFERADEDLAPMPCATGGL